MLTPIMRPVLVDLPTLQMDAFKKVKTLVWLDDLHQPCHLRFGRPSTNQTRKHQAEDSRKQMSHQMLTGAEKFRYDCMMLLKGSIYISDLMVGDEGDPHSPRAVLKPTVSVSPPPRLVSQLLVPLLADLQRLPHSKGCTESTVPMAP